MQEHHVMAGLSYVGILVLIPVIMHETKNEFVAFHVKQGSAILIGEILAIFSTQWFPRVAGLVFLVLFVTSLIAFFRTIQGEKWRLLPI
ncbi:MAG: hypothetical protein ABIP54_01215 [Candidatus Andersenbacteria bacterium]